LGLLEVEHLELKVVLRGGAKGGGQVGNGSRTAGLGWDLEENVTERRKGTKKKVRMSAAVHRRDRTTRPTVTGAEYHSGKEKDRTVNRDSAKGRSPRREKFMRNSDKYTTDVVHTKGSVRDRRGGDGKKIAGTYTSRSGQNTEKTRMEKKKRVDNLGETVRGTAKGRGPAQSGDG